MAYTDIKLGGVGVTQITLSDGTILWKKNSWKGLTIKNVDTSEYYVSFRVGSKVTKAPNVEYSLDNGSTWTTLELTIGENTSFNVKAGSSVYLRGVNNNGFNTNTSNQSYGYYTYISIGFNCELSGNIMSLINYNSMDNFSNIPSGGFNNLFSGCKTIQSAENLNFGNAETVYEWGCADMFYGCTNMVKAPDLSSFRYVNKYGLSEMFTNCTSLVEAPDLKNIWYQTDDGLGAMYKGCTNLATIYTPSDSVWKRTTYDYISWVEDAGTSVTGDKIMYTTKTLSTLIPSGESGYGAYTLAVRYPSVDKTVTFEPSEYTYSATYQIDDGDEVSVDAGTTATITIPSTATSLTLNCGKGYGDWYLNNKIIGYSRPITIDVGLLNDGDQLYTDFSS